MRSRTAREGTVGLLILGALALFVGVALWLKGLNPANRSFKIFIEFANSAGLQDGAPVRFRGVSVGKIVGIKPMPNKVEVEAEISPADIIIPSNVIAQVNQSGLISQTAIELIPKQLLKGTVDTKPLDRDCDTTVIVCNNARLPGEGGVSVDELIRSSVKFANTYADPAFFNNVNAVVKNTSEAAAEITKLSKEFNLLTQNARQELKTFSASAAAISRTADKIGITADQVNALISTNQATLVSTLDNLGQTSIQLRSTVGSFGTTINRVNRGELLQNLDTLIANAAKASANLRAASDALNSPANVLMLQQTLDSARSTFQNAQKITADLDELTGDPAFRNNLRNLVNGLSGLVSSTQQLQQQTQTAQILTPIAASLKQSNSTEIMVIPVPPTPSSTPQPPTPNPKPLPPNPHPLTPHSHHPAGSLSLYKSAEW
ncbi:MAG: MlaD family protein, partial [Leptolyngbyaceae cyanobacterium bins.302]|nr:MlaD family protein [Leptolyngbyaceae cyanobacterium bins.302]